MATFKELTQNPLFIPLSENNKKLIPNKDTRFLIWNLPSKITCPYATEHCKKFCYAVKAETAYPNCKPSRMRHLNISKDDNFSDRMIYTIETYLLKPSYQTAKKVVVRIHESGDFYNLPYMAKWFEIAEHFKSNKKVVFMAYTKSIEYLRFLVIPKNMVVRFSVWDDTPINQIALAIKYDLPIYTAVDKFTSDIKSQNRCLCKDCAKCGKCWGKTSTIICEIH